MKFPAMKMTILINSNHSYRVGLFNSCLVEIFSMKWEINIILRSSNSP